MSETDILINKISQVKSGDIILPASKSVHNRSMIIKYLAGNKTTLTNPSNARDSVLMAKLLSSAENELNAQDAGTTYRFLTAFLTVTNQNRILTGTERMKQRPIGELVSALRILGGKVDYLQSEGYPPIHIKGIENNDVSEITMRGDISSQYISAVMMIAPLLNKMLTINLTGRVGSRPYIDMTAELMMKFSARIEVLVDKIIIYPSSYKAINELDIEPDWSAASYWYSLVSISGIEGIKLKGLRKNSLQGDSVIQSIMQDLGVETIFNNYGALLKPKEASTRFEFDFNDCPDLAQTVAVVCAAKGIHCTMRGLESLKIKETDRISALKNELAKFKVTFQELNGKWIIDQKIVSREEPISINTYKDHRMAMAFAPLAFMNSLLIQDPEVVQKSYPHFWDDFLTLTT